MTGEPGATAELARMIEEISGNVVPPDHFPYLEQAARKRLMATGQRDLASYVKALRRGALADEWSGLLPLVTVNESSFFRTPQHFRALSTTVLPLLMQRRAATRTLRIWSAGCARGEEPGTLAMVLADTPELVDWRWRILATDVDEQALEDARRGCYGTRSVASVPAARRDAHFSRRGDVWELDAGLRARIDFRRHNLIGEAPGPSGVVFDLVFLRNVLIYFRPEAQRRVVASVAHVLAPDGFLFLGPAETLWQLVTDLEPIDLGDCFCYQHRPPSHPQDRTGGRGNRADNLGAVPTHSRAPAIRPASDPTRAEQKPQHDRLARSPGDGAMPSRDSTTTARKERGTIERLQAASEALSREDAETATMLTQEALRTDPTDAEAHALEGFIHDLSGRAGMAIASYRAALYLDCRFFQARLLLAEALRRSGWADRAQVEYREVLALLSSGRARALTSLTALPFADRDLAVKRCRQAL